MDFRSNRRTKAKTAKRQVLRRRLKVEHLAARRVLAAISGTVFEDIDVSYRQEAGEQSLAQRLVYLDVNQNAAVDTGEPFALTGADGEFTFAGLPDGQYQVRLYDGSTSQKQVTPVDATRPGSSLLVPDATGIATSGELVGLLTNGAVTLGSYGDGSLENFVVPESPSVIEKLPDGNFLLLGSNDGSNSAWLANPVDKTLSPIDLAPSVPAAFWSDVVIDVNGHGILLQVDPNDEAGDSLVYRIDASDQAAGIVVADLGIRFPNDVQLTASQTGNRSIVAWAGQWTDTAGDQAGLQVSLWSNASGTAITDVPMNLADTSEVLDYDDESGLLALRTAEGGVSVFDVNADFALLSTVADVSGPVAIDGQRSLLVTMSADESTLDLIDARDGQLVTSVDINVAELGTIQGIAVQQSDTLVLLGTDGTSRVSFVKPAAHHVTLVGGSDSEAIRFGVVVQGQNNAPLLPNALGFETNEDEVLVAPSPVGVLAGVTDADQDRLVVLQMGSANNGVAIVTVAGDLHYTPDLNFNGVDAFPVIIHDGTSGTDIVAVQLDVVPVDDLPEIILPLDVIPENLAPETVLGPVSVVDPDDGDEHELEITDNRFEIIDGQLVYVGPDEINYETEPFVYFDIYDTEYLTTASFTLEVQDGDDPILYIDPDFVDIEENSPGVYVTQIDVYDEDGVEGIAVSVDDDRFVIVGSDLYLKPGVSLDYEAGSVFTINITATNVGGDSLTEPLEVTVFDRVEKASSIALSDETVLELSEGAEVGGVIVDGHLVGDSYTATVDDSRFEIVDGILKLVDGKFVNRNDQEEIELTIDVQDVGGYLDSTSATFLIEVLENSKPFHNDSFPFDVNGSGDVSPLDALIIINFISEHGAGEIAPAIPEFDLDVNGDGLVTPLDILLVLNYLNAIKNGDTGTVGSENGGSENGGGGEGNSINPSGELIAPIENITADSFTQDEDPIADAPAEATPLQKSRFSSLQANQYALADSVLNDDNDSLVDEGSVTAEQYADGVDASLDSLLDELS